MGFSRSSGIDTSKTTTMIYDYREKSFGNSLGFIGH